MKVLIVTNMLPSPENPKAGTFIEQQITSLEDIGVDLEVVLVDRANRGMGSYRATRELVGQARLACRPDLTHVMYGGVLSALALDSDAREAQVVSFCGVDLLGANYGSLAYRLRTWIGRQASLRAARKADGIIVKSKNLREGLPAGVDPSIVSIIPNGISLDRFQPMDRTECRRKLGWSPGVFHILFSTNDRTDKKKRLPLAEAAVELCRGRGVDAEIHGLHRVPHDEVAIWLNAADVVLMTSRFDEGSPNIIKEGLACNRPVVSVDVGDVAERIDGIDGCYLADASPAALADKLMLVQRGRRAVDAREKIAELSLERVARRVVDVYEQTLERVAGRR